MAKNKLPYIYIGNALSLLRAERDSRVRGIASGLAGVPVEAAVEDWLANPFVSTALSILKTFNRNYKVREALRLLNEAGKEVAEEKRKAKVR